MATVVTAPSPAWLVCSHCQVTLPQPPPGLTATRALAAALLFVRRHETSEGVPTIPHALPMPIAGRKASA